MASEFENRVVLVTGGSSGIGRATALAFAREGARLIVSDVDVEGGEDTVGMIRDSGAEGLFVRADVSNAAEVAAMVDHTVRRYGQLDHAFNNAGVLGDRDYITDCTEENWDRVIDTNLKGVWLCMKYEILQMLKQGAGSIVNASSYAGLVASHHSAAYAASKHGVIGLTQTAALRYAWRGIRINAVCPTITRTPMIETAFGKYPEDVRTRVQEASIHRQPLRRMGRPEEIAEAVLWLCSDAASLVIGHAMAVDGGYMAQ